MKKYLIILSILFFNFGNSQQLAFPDAYGAGAYATGGRGGKIVHVTNLNDSGVGSLRWALLDNSNKADVRTIVFDVSGLINLNSDIYMSNNPGDTGGFVDGITIAGQTAPLGGITITGGKIRMFSINNVIVRYLTFRETTSTDGCFSNTNGNNIIIDHLSGSHTGDIIFSITSSDQITTNKTIQNCLFAQSKNGLIIGDSSPLTDEDYGDISVLRNAYYNVGWRVPFKGGGAIKVDAINNIAHSWSDRLIRMDAYDYTLNHIENYYQAGGSTTNRLLWVSWNNNVNATPRIYNQNNFLEDAPRGSYSKPSGYDLDESVAWTEFQNNFQQLPSSWFASTMYPLKGRVPTILSNSQLKTEVLSLVGNSQYINDSGDVSFYRDSYDTVYVNGINNNDNISRDSSDPSPITVLSNSRPAGFDKDGDGIPDLVEDANGLDKNDATDGALIHTSGYSNLEYFYLNKVDEVTPDTTPPTDPTNITISNITNTTATVTWNASTDDVGVSGYYIKNGVASISTVTGGESYNFTSLSPDTTYFFFVSAFDAAGNESADVQFSFTTTNTAAPEPSPVNKQQAKKLIIINY